MQFNFHVLKEDVMHLDAFIEINFWFFSDFLIEICMTLKGLRKAKMKIYIESLPLLDQRFFLCKLLLNGSSHDIH